MRVEAFGDHCNPAGKIVVDLIFGLGPGMGDALFKVAGQFADLGQLIAQLHRCFAADPGGMGGGLFELACCFGGAVFHRLVDGCAAFLAKPRSKRRDRGRAHRANPGDCGRG